MKKLVRPIREVIKESETDQVQELSSTLSLLIDQFKKDALNGRIKFRSANDFTKLVNSFLVLQQAEKINTNPESSYKVHLNSLIEEDDPIVQELYQKLFNSINDENDERNKEASDEV